MARAVTMPTDSIAAGRAELGDRHPCRLAGPVRPRTGHHVEGEGSLEDIDAGGHRRLVERPLDLGTAAVAAGVDDAVVAVPALPRQCRPLPVGVRVERRAEAHQVADRRRRLGDELPHDGFVAQPGPGGQCVADVVLDGVGRVEDAGQPALRPRRGPGVQHVLGHHQHAAHRPHRERRSQPGGTRPEHDDVHIPLPRQSRRSKPHGQDRHGDVVLTMWPLPHERGRSRRPSARRAGAARRRATAESSEFRASEAITRPSATGCRSRSSARPSVWPARRCRAGRRRRLFPRAASAAAWPA